MSLFSAGPARQSPCPVQSVPRLAVDGSLQHTSSFGSGRAHLPAEVIRIGVACCSHDEEISGWLNQGTKGAVPRPALQHLDRESWLAPEFGSHGRIDRRHWAAVPQRRAVSASNSRRRRLLAHGKRKGKEGEAEVCSLGSCGRVPCFEESESGKAHIEIRRDGIGRQEQRGPNGEGASSRGHGASAGRGFRVQIRRREAEAEAASIRSRGKEACRGRALRERRNSHPPCCDLTGGPLLAPAPLSASRRTGHLCSGSRRCHVPVASMHLQACLPGFPHLH